MLGVRLQAVSATPTHETGVRTTPAHDTKGNSMGDKGGKKDKKKNQQQLATKQKQKEQRKQDKAPSRPLAATT